SIGSVRVGRVDRQHGVDRRLVVVLADADLGRRRRAHAAGTVVVDLTALSDPLLAAGRTGHDNERNRKPLLVHGITSSRGATSSHSTATTSYSRLPLGLCTITASPSSLPISARATGAPIEIRPRLMSASCSPTIV